MMPLGLFQKVWVLSSWVRSSIASQSTSPPSRALRTMLPSLYVLLELVFEQGAGHELIEQLPQRERESLRKIFRNDGVGLLDHYERGSVRLPGDEDFASHHAPLLLFC
jgi:hypothetical protein